MPWRQRLAYAGGVGLTVAVVGAGWFFTVGTHLRLAVSGTVEEFRGTADQFAEMRASVPEAPVPTLTPPPPSPADLLRGAVSQALARQRAEAAVADAARRLIEGAKDEEDADVETPAEEALETTEPAAEEPQL